MSTPTTWAMICPPEPGPEVTCVEDVDKDLWDRIEDGWLCRRQFGGVRFVESWSVVVAEFGPLTDATPAVTP